MPNGILARTTTDSPAAAEWRQMIVATAGLPAMRRACTQAGRDQRWLNREQLKLCRIPAPTFREGERAEHLRSVFLELGHRPRIDAAGNVVVPINYSPRLPYLAVTAHMDTTLAPGRPEDIRVEANGTMHGPGVTDNGTGLTALLALARLMHQSPVESPRRNLLLVANVAEEGEGNLQGMRFMAGQSPFAKDIDRFLVVDGASLSHITTAALGSRRFELTMEGPGGHSWNDYGRPNPVHAISRSVALMARIPLPKQPKTTLSVGVIQGGSSVNAIASVARAKIDIRSTDDREIRKVVKAVEDVVRRSAIAESRSSTEPLTAFQLRDIGHRPAASALACNPVADCFRAVDDFLGIASTCSCASTDANIPLAAGIPTVAIGTGGRGGNAHAPSEWYDPNGREIGLRRLLLGVASMQMRN